MNFKKKLLAGILGGAMLFSFGTSFAAPPETDEICREESFAQSSDREKYFSEKYGISSAQIEQAFKDGARPADIRQAAILAKLSGKSFSEVLAMKVDWPQVAQKLGVVIIIDERGFDEHGRHMSMLDDVRIELPAITSVELRPQTNIDDGQALHDLILNALSTSQV